jgi:hypothetical protein
MSSSMTSTSVLQSFGPRFPKGDPEFLVSPGLEVDEGVKQPGTELISIRGTILKEV